MNGGSAHGGGRGRGVSIRSTTSAGHPSTWCFITMLSRDNDVPFDSNACRRPISWSQQCTMPQLRVPPLSHVTTHTAGAGSTRLPAGQTLPLPLSFHSLSWTIIARWSTTPQPSLSVVHQVHHPLYATTRCPRSLLSAQSFLPSFSLSIPFLIYSPTYTPDFSSFSYQRL